MARVVKDMFVCDLHVGDIQFLNINSFGMNLAF